MGPSRSSRPARSRRRLVLVGSAAALAVASGIALTSLGVGLTAVGLGGAAAPGGPITGLARTSPGRTGSASAPSLTPTSTPSSTPSPATPPTSSTPPVPAPNPNPNPSPRVQSPLHEMRGLLLRSQLQAELDRTRIRLGIPGASVTILLPDGTEWTGTSGLADVRRATAVTPDTAFALGSVSKTYTSAIILGLVGDGRINLDAPVRRYLPDAAVNPRITVRQLLDHTSGLYDYFLNPSIDKALLAKRNAPWTTKQTLRFVGKPYFPPGRGWHYSNTNYLYLGLIAERVTGMPLAAALRTRLFKPLALDGTWYQAAEKPRTALAHGYRFAAPKVGGPAIDLSDGSAVAPFTSVVTAAAGAGSIAATSSDVAHWARALYSGAVLGPQMTAEMLGDVSRTAAYRPPVPYGLGVQSTVIDGRLAVGHSGRLLGFRASMRYLPSYDLTITVLTNQSRADPGVIVQRLLAVVFTPPPPCTRCHTPS